MEGARLAPAKVLPAWQAALAAVVVPGALERRDVVPNRCRARPAGGDVEHWLGAHAGDRGPADMFQPQRQRAALVAYPARFIGEEERPPFVVVDERNDA